MQLLRGEIERLVEAVVRQKPGSSYKWKEQTKTGFKASEDSQFRSSYMFQPFSSSFPLLLLSTLPEKTPERQYADGYNVTA